MSNNILNALAKLDHADDDQWLPDGSPKVAVVQKLADDTTITKAVIEHAAPDFRWRTVETDPLGEIDAMLDAPVEEASTGPIDNALDAPPLTSDAEPPEVPPGVMSGYDHNPPDDLVETADDPAVLLDNIVGAQKRLVQSQIDLRIARDRQREAKGKVMAALGQWNHVAGETPNFQSLVRQHLAAENQRRADVASGKIEPRRNMNRPGPSLIDKLAYGHGSAPGYRSAGWRRGAYPASQRGRKLPSQL